MMWIVVDWNCTQFYGPFPDQGLAYTWLSRNGVKPPLDETEYSIHKLIEGNVVDDAEAKTRKAP